MSDPRDVILAKLRDLRVFRLSDPNRPKLHTRAALLKRALADQVTGVTPLSGPPQAFQIVELSRASGKNVNDEVDVVQQNPLAFGVPLDVQRADTLFFESFFNMVRNGLIVACRGSGTNEEVIRERTNVA